MKIAETSCKCMSSQKKAARSSALSFLTGLFIAILPKCPLCVLAYSSALSAGAFTTCAAEPASQGLDWTIFVSIALILLTLFLVLKNFRGKRTWVAVGIILFGSAHILYSAFTSGDMADYYYGAFALLIGVWVNASFLYFFRTYISPFINTLQSMVKDSSQRA